MKAVVFTEYGSPDVLRLEEIEKPVPKKGEVLVKVHASSVNAGDWHLLRADPFLVRLAFGLMKPKVNVLGADITGEVESVGEGVTAFKPGDAVMADISNNGFGGFAEYACAPEAVLARKPERLSFEEAAAVPAAAVTALQALRQHGKLKAGEHVLINGASGGVGSYAVQIAKALGATVTGVCSARNLERVRALGAEHVMDYRKDDFTRCGKHYDLILAANGYHSIFSYRRALTPNGRYVLSGGEMNQFVQALLLGPILSAVTSNSMGTMLVAPNGKDLAYVGELIAENKVNPAIDRTYPLAEVPQAIRHMEEVHTQGKLVISIVTP